MTAPTTLNTGKPPRAAISGARQLGEGGVAVVLSTIATYWVVQAFPSMPQEIAVAHGGLLVVLIEYGASRLRDRGLL